MFIVSTRKVSLSLRKCDMVHQTILICTLKYPYLQMCHIQRAVALKIWSFLYWALHVMLNRWIKKILLHMTQYVIHYLSNMDPLQNIQKALITIFQAPQKCLLIFLKQLHKNMWQNIYTMYEISNINSQPNIFLTIIVPCALQGIGRWTG